MREPGWTTTMMVGLIMLAVTMIAPGWAEAPAGEGWTSLFNGKDLTGWKIPEGDNGHWKVIEGVIDYDAASEAPGNKSLYTTEEFGDFILKIDWRFKEYSGMYPMPVVKPDGSYEKDKNGKNVTIMRLNSDSGVIVRGNTQANLWCWPIGSGEIWSYRTNPDMPPEIRAGATPKVRADNPVGEWNSFVITMKGERITVVLNGKTVIENAHLPGIPQKGPIGLQHHGGKRPDGTLSPASSLVQFRNIYIKKLD